MERALGLSGERPPRWLRAEFDGGVGLLRGEYILRDLGVYVTREPARERIVDYLVEAARWAGTAPVWYRTSDLESPEACALEGVEEAFWENDSSVGARGIRRGVRHPGSLRAELEAFAEAQRRRPNLHLLYPFVSTAEEASFGMAEALAAGVRGPIGLMAETPAAVLTLPELLDIGYRHVLMGCNDLWSLTMARKRAPGYFPTATPALARAADLVRAHTAAAGATMHVGGYLDGPLLEMARHCGADAAVLHYSQLPALLGQRCAELPDLDHMADVKRRSRAAVSRLRELVVAGQAAGAGITVI